VDREARFGVQKSAFPDQVPNSRPTLARSRVDSLLVRRSREIARTEAGVPLSER